MSLEILFMMRFCGENSDVARNAFCKIFSGINPSVDSDPSPDTFNIKIKMNYLRCVLDNLISVSETYPLVRIYVYYDYDFHDSYPHFFYLLNGKRVDIEDPYLGNDLFCR